MTKLVPADQAEQNVAHEAAGGASVTGRHTTDAADVLVSKPLSQILTFWRPGSHDWTWKEEFADLIDHPVTEEIRRRVDAEGFGFIDHLAPVMLGSDGRVWDGHHRICLAIEQGRDSLMVEIVDPPQGAPAHEFVHHGMWADCICGHWSISADDAESDGRSEFRAHVDEAERVAAQGPPEEETALARQEVLTGGVEPQDVGAHIEDGTGAEWVRVHRAGGPAPWHLVSWRAAQRREPWSTWSAIPEPTLLLNHRRPGTRSGQ